MREVLLLSIFFFAVSIFSIYLGILTREAILSGKIEPVFQNPSDYRNSFYLLILILIGTAIMLALTKIKFEFIKILENIALLFLISTTFSYFLPSPLQFLPSLLLIALSEVRPSFLLKNVCLLLSVPSASAIIGASLDYRVVLLFFFALTLYDIISVFLTKHMVYLAEKLIEKPTALISVFPSGKVRNVRFGKGVKKIGVIALGAGDYFMPSSFSVSLLQLGIKHALFPLFFNTIALFVLFYLLSKRKITRPLPAIPFLFLSSLAALFVSFYL